MKTDQMPWATLRENIFFKRLARDEDRNFQFDLIRLDPSVKLAEHLHSDVEWVYILKGSFADENGKHEAGDFILNPKGSKHTVTAGSGGCEILCCWCGTIIPTENV